METYRDATEILYALEMIFGDRTKVNEFLDLNKDKTEENGPKAANLIRIFEALRHDKFGAMMNEYLGISHPGDLSVYKIIKIISGYLQLTLDEQLQLQSECDVNKTPDAMHISVQENGRVIVSIIDYKVRSNIEQARQETMTKYMNAISQPLAALGKCDVEILIIGLNSKSGEVFMDHSENQLLNVSYNEFLADGQMQQYIEVFTKANLAFFQFDYEYRKIQSYQKHRHRSDLAVVTTAGYFTEEIPKLLDCIFKGGKENLSQDDYTFDDVFRLDSYNNSKLRLLCLLVEYYDYPLEELNIQDEIYRMINWLEMKENSKLHVVAVYNRVYRELPDFRNYITGIKEGNDDLINSSSRKLKKEVLDKAYEDLIEKKCNELLSTDEEIIKDFKPSEPKVEDLERGLSDCVKKLKDGKECRFIHMDESQQSFNFLLPTSTCLEEVNELSELCNISSNDAKFLNILQALREDTKAFNENVSYWKKGLHWQKEIKEMLTILINDQNEIAVTIMVNKSGIPDSPNSEFLLKKQLKKEFYEFLELINQCTFAKNPSKIKTYDIKSGREEGKVRLKGPIPLNDKDFIDGLNDINGYRKLSEKERKDIRTYASYEDGTIPDNIECPPEYIEKNMIKINNIITDGVNISVGKRRHKFLKALGKKAGKEPIMTKEVERLHNYQLHCGISLKSKKRELELGKGVITIQDIKEVKDHSHELTLVDEHDIIFKDTRTKVLDYNCEECKACSTLWQEELENVCSHIDSKHETKLQRTIKDIIESENHKNCKKPVRQTKERIDVLYSSMMVKCCESLSQLFEGLLIKSEFNKPDTIALSFSSSPDVVLIKLPGEKLFNPSRTVPYIMIKKLKKSLLVPNSPELSSLIIDAECTDYYISTKHYLYIVSKPQRLDLNRINTLSKSECRLILAATTLFDTTLQEGHQNLQRCNIRKLIASSFRLTCTVSISQMSLRDPMKYLFTLALADSSDIYGFLTNKFKYHIKSINDLSLFQDLIYILKQLIMNRVKIKEENQTKVQLTITEEEVVEGGWLTFDIDSPFTGTKYRDVKQLINEILINVYFVQKELHNPITNLEKLVKVPCEFEVELKKSLSNDLQFDKFSKNHMMAHGCKSDCEELLKLNLNRFFFNKDTFNGTKQFGYDPAVTILSCRSRHKAEAYKTQYIRPKIESEEGLLRQMVSVQTLTSSKSSTDHFDSRLEGGKEWLGSLSSVSSGGNIIMSRNKAKGYDNDLIKKRLEAEIKDVKVVEDLEVLKTRLKLWSSILTIKERSIRHNGAIITRDQEDKVRELVNKLIEKVIHVKTKQSSKKSFNIQKWKQKNIVISKNGYIQDQIPDKTYETYMKFLMQSWIQTETLPVKEAMYKLLQNLKKLLNVIDDETLQKFDNFSVVDFCKLMCLIRYENGLYCNQFMPIVRMFPKGQRTFVDREIYIMDIACKIQLYYIEHVYKHMNKINDYEAISLPGEAKPYYIGKQEIDFLINNQKLEIKDKERYGENKYINHLNADESKWSARDVPLKFVDAHLCAMASKLSERLMMIKIQFSYTKKVVVIPTQITQRITLQQSKRALGEDKNNSIMLCTDGLSKNYVYVSFNWLQGNFNYLSSFVHTAVMEFMKHVHDRYFKAFMLRTSFRTCPNITNFTSMVHSDDGTISSSVCLDDRTLAAFERKWTSYSRFIFYMVKDLKRMFAIELNLMKTFCSESIKDFISEFLINGEFIGNYARYIPNCCGDSNFKSFKEDISMLMSAPQSMAKRGSTLETLLISISVVNYHVYHTYSMAVGELNDPISAYMEVLKFLDNPPKSDKLSIEILTEMKREKKNILLKKKVDRNKLTTSLGGYCNPPLNLLALVGARAHDAKVTMDSFHILMKSGKFSSLVNNPDKISVVTVKTIIDVLKRNELMLPSIDILVSSFIIRQEMGHINAKYSKFDVNRLNHINILTYPQTRNEERFPVRYPSYKDFMAKINNRDEIFKDIRCLLKEPKNLTGTCASSSLFETRVCLDYQLTKRVEIYQTLGTAVQRLFRLIDSNKRLFLPINVIDGLDKIKLSESLKAFEDDTLGLMDSKIKMLKSEIKAIELEIEKFHKLDGRKFHDVSENKRKISHLKKKKTELAEYADKRDKLREVHDNTILLERSKLSDSLYLLAAISKDISSKGKKDCGFLNPDHIRANPEAYSTAEKLRCSNKINPLRSKMTLSEAIKFLILLSVLQPVNYLVESYIYSLLALVFNDRIMSFFLKMDLSSRQLGSEGKPTATLQKIIYPYQVRPLSFRAEDIVKCVLMPDNDSKDYREAIGVDDPAFEQDVHIVQTIVEDIELTETIRDIKERLTRYKYYKGNEESSVYEALTTIRRYSIVYNILLKAINMYYIRQAYTLSRAVKSNIAFKFFTNFKGNFVESERYIEHDIDSELLKEFHLNVYTESSSSLWELKSVLDSVISLIERCQRLIGLQFGPKDLQIILESSRYNGENMWKYLVESIPTIQKKLFDLKNYIPVLYHLGLIGEGEALSKIDDQNVTCVWIIRHQSRNPMRGQYHVKYRCKKIEVSLYGSDDKIDFMDIKLDSVYASNDNYRVHYIENISPILRKIVEDFRIKFTKPQGHKVVGTIYYKKKKGEPEIYFIVNSQEAGMQWSEIEKRVIMMSSTCPKLVNFQYNRLEKLANVIIDFYSVEYSLRNLFHLYKWNIEDYGEDYMLDQYGSEKAVVYSELYGLEIPYEFVVPHNKLKYIPIYPETDVRGSHVLILKAKMARLEKMANIDVLCDTCIEINGISLQCLLNTIKNIEDSTLHRNIFKLDDLPRLVPKMSEIVLPILALGEELETSSEVLSKFEETVQYCIATAFADHGSQWAINWDNKVIRVDENIYRQTLNTNKYKTLVVNILNRFPSSTINIQSILKSIVASCTADKRLSKLLSRNPFGCHEGPDVDETICETITGLVVILYHINNLELHYDKRCKDLKRMLFEKAHNSIHILCTLLYLIMLLKVLESTNLVIIDTNTMALVNDRFKMRLSKTIFAAKSRYEDDLPRDEEFESDIGAWSKKGRKALSSVSWQEPSFSGGILSRSTGPFKILTSDNLCKLKVYGKLYIDIIKDKVKIALYSLDCYDSQDSEQIVELSKSILQI